jgi:DNA end-binding protein Ku
MARQLVESLAGIFDPEDYRNSYRDELRAMLEAKLAGQEIVRPEPAPEAPVIDLMEALKQSVAAAAKGEQAPKGARKGSAPRRRRATA